MRFVAEKFKRSNNAKRLIFYITLYIQEVDSTGNSIGFFFLSYSLGYPYAAIAQVATGKV